MKHITYNVNGIRAAINKNLIEWLKSTNTDTLCLQEIKATKEQINIELFEELGYHHYWFPAERKGYSGVAVLSKQSPKSVSYGMGRDQYDSEGRVLVVEFEEYTAVSVYVPSATNIERLDFKMQFCYDFLNFINELRKKTSKIVISGDFNICHQAIDIHDPVRLKNVSGFLPIEREWMSEFILKCDLLDTFRVFNFQPGNYTWWSYRQISRERNKGWRLDYNFVTKEMESQLSSALILKDAVHSDHCPALVEF